MADKPIKSVAAHVLATGEATDEEAQRLAGYALGDAQPTRTAKSFEELQQLLQKIQGVEGQSERANAIQAEMNRMGQG